MRALWPWVGIGVLALAGGAALALQRQQTEQLRDELVLQRTENGELVRLRAERARLLAAQVPAAELAGLRADHATVARLRDEITALRGRAEAMERAAAAPPAPKLKPASEWKNLGRATPSAAMETALWAAAGGDLETLVRGLRFDEAARARTEAWFAQMPAEARGRYGSPERLLALLIARETPLGGMRVAQEIEQGPDDVALRVLLRPVDGSVKNTGFTLHREPDGWKFVVSAEAVERFMRTVKEGVEAGR